MTPPTPQIDFWRGAFGDEYTNRNSAEPDKLRARIALWAEILSHTIAQPPATILEIGANIGVNLRALRNLTGARLLAVEPNDKARGILLEDEIVRDADLKPGIASAVPFPDGCADFTFTAGVLIHINPADLLASMREIHRCSSRYVASIEYFSDKPVETPYRGHDDVLFKRDFGGYWLDNFSDLRVLAYGFAWKRVTGLDNLTWWLFEKR